MKQIAKRISPKFMLIGGLLGVISAPSLATETSFSTNMPTLTTLQSQSSAVLSSTSASATDERIDQLLAQLSSQQDNNATLLKTSASFTSNSRDSLALSSPLISTGYNQSSSLNTESDAFDADTLSRLALVASNSTGKFRQNGRASWYGGKFHGRKTASGERFNMHAMTAAHKSLPFNTFLKVTNKSNGKSVIVKVNDRGPFVGNRILDLSYGAAKQIGLVNRGVGNVTIEKVKAP